MAGTAKRQKWNFRCNCWALIKKVLPRLRRQSSSWLCLCVIGRDENGKQLNVVWNLRLSSSSLGWTKLVAISSENSKVLQAFWLSPFQRQSPRLLVPLDFYCRSLRMPRKCFVNQVLQLKIFCMRNHLERKSIKCLLLASLVVFYACGTWSLPAQLHASPPWIKWFARDSSTSHFGEGGRRKAASGASSIFSFTDFLF